MPKELLFEKKERIALITLNRPEDLNAVSLEMRKEMKDIFEEINFDPKIGAVVLQGAGRAFCAGGDVKSMGGYSAGAGRLRLKNMHYLIRSLTLCDKPVIAAVNGFVAGAGMALALACDLRVAADDTKFIASFLNVGLVPDSGCFYFLPRLVGMAKAKEIIYLPKPLDAQRALELGLVNQVSSVAEFRERALAIAEDIATRPQTALALTKSILNRSFEMDLDQALDFEALAQDVCFQTADHQEGLQAFREKRKPAFNQV